MGKLGSADKDETAKVLYKKSNHIFQSRTCSGVSEVCTRSGIAQMKKRLSQSEQYCNQGEGIKKDLSIETDICVLRRYCKRKRNKRSTQGSIRSGYSTIVDAEIETIEEFQKNNSACGDSETPEINTNLQLDIAKLMVDNFKDLIFNWIENFSQQNQLATTKLDTAFYSMIHKTDTARTDSSSSRSTFIISKDGQNQRVKNKKIATKSIVFQSCKTRILNNHDIIKNYYKNVSRHSSPIQHKHRRIVSTLSIPRNIHKQTKNTKRNFITSKFNRKALVLTINNSNKFLSISSFDLLNISTKSFTKRCATYGMDVKRSKTEKKERHIIFYPKLSSKGVNDSIEDNLSINAENERSLFDNHIDTMPSLVKSIYADDPANITSTENTVNRKTYNKITMTQGLNFSEKSFANTKCVKMINVVAQTSKSKRVDKIQSDSMVKNTNDLKTSDNYTSTKPSNIEKNNLKSINKRNKNRSCYKITKSKTARNVHSAVKHETANQRSQRKKFIQNCQNVFEYFTSNGIPKDIRLDIEIKIVPTHETKKEDKCTATIVQHYNISESCKSGTVVCNVEPIRLDYPKLTNSLNMKESNVYNNNNIIPLLDGALSQTKYIFKTDSTEANSDATNISIRERNTLTDAELIKDINELKLIIKDLTEAAHAFVIGHAKEINKRSQFSNKTTATLLNSSKGIQYSNEPAKQQLLSGIKLSKYPKKNPSEYFNRLLKKSTSYNVIESEQVIKVTDMTSQANNIDNPSKTVRKSKSLINVSKEKAKLLTYFCDGYNKPEAHVNGDNVNLHCKDDHSPESTKNSQITRPSKGHASIPIYSANLDDKVEEKDNKAPKKPRKGLGFGEGLLYCSILWIPVIMIAFLFYRYAIKDMLPEKCQENEPGRLSRSLLVRQKDRKNTSSFRLALSDLGF